MIERNCRDFAHISLVIYSIFLSLGMGLEKEPVESADAGKRELARNSVRFRRQHFGLACKPFHPVL